MVAVYVELIRNTPFIVQLFFIFFGLPSLGVRLTPELRLGDRDGGQPRRLRGGDRARRHRGHAARADRGRPQPGDDRAPGVSVGRAAAVAVAGLAALVSQIIIVMLGSAVCGQIAAQELSRAANSDPEPQLPRLRGLHRARRAVYLLLSIVLRRLAS